MTKKTDNKSAVAKVAADKLKEAHDAVVATGDEMAKAQAAFDGLAAESSDEVKSKVQETLILSAEAHEKAVKALGDLEKDCKVHVRALLPLAGKFKLPYDPGHEFEIDEQRGKEIVEAGYGEIVE